MFVRYLGTEFDQAVPYAITKNPLASSLPGANDLVQAVTFGDTYLFGSSVVNSFRATFNRSASLRVPANYFGPEDVGINVYNYVPHFLEVTVTGGFSTGGLSAGRSHTKNVVAQLSDDVGFTRGSHQMAFGASLVGYQQVTHATTYAPPLFTITGSATGLGLADLMTGQTASLTQGAPTHTNLKEYYLGLYAQDSWRVTSGLTVSYGLRWEPYFPTQQGRLGPSGENENFNMSGFLQGVRSKVFVNAPPGLYFPGDALYGPNGSSGINKAWKHFAPRVGILWDPTKSGKTVIRAGYGIFYDQIPTEEYGSTGQSPPWGGKLNLLSVPGGLANPYAGQPGGNPFPFVLNGNTAFPQYGTFDTFYANTQIPYVQQWNFGIQRQVGHDWLVSVSYIGNEMTHLYGFRELNPAVYIPGTCVTGQYGLTAPGNCSTTANTNQRRLLTLLNPAAGSAYGFVDVWDDGGTRHYNGLLLNTQKRLSHGFTVTANYTWSHCISELVNSFPQTGAGGSGLYFAPTRAGDRGSCTVSGSDVNSGGGTDRRHIANMSGIATMPNFSNKTLRMIASDWRGSATVNMYGGGPLIIVTGIDNALNGINAVTQYANQVLPNVYGNRLPGSGGTAHWLNPAAFAQPAPGTQANMAPGSVRGPGALIFNAGLSRLFRIKERQTVELRGEAQNVLNRANFSDPGVTLNSNTFGQIIGTGPARIMQFALKYNF
jgi:hypothetical protein